MAGRLKFRIRSIFHARSADLAIDKMHGRPRQGELPQSQSGHAVLRFEPETLGSSRPEAA